MQRCFDYEILCVLKVIPYPRSDNFVTRFQIIRWSTGVPVIEKRVYRRMDNGEWRPLKLRGWDHEDVTILRDRFDEILEVLNEG